MKAETIARVERERASFKEIGFINVTKKYIKNREIKIRMEYYLK